MKKIKSILAATASIVGILACGALSLITLRSSLPKPAETDITNLLMPKRLYSQPTDQKQVSLTPFISNDYPIDPEFNHIYECLVNVQGRLMGAKACERLFKRQLEDLIPLIDAYQDAALREKFRLYQAEASKPIDMSDDDELRAAREQYKEFGDRIERKPLSDKELVESRKRVQFYEGYLSGGFREDKARYEQRISDSQAAMAGYKEKWIRFQESLHAINPRFPVSRTRAELDEQW